MDEIQVIKWVIVWNKWSANMKGRFYKACMRGEMVYVGETWVMRKEEEGVMQRVDRVIVRIMCGVKLMDIG